MHLLVPEESHSDSAGFAGFAGFVGFAALESLEVLERAIVVVETIEAVEVIAAVDMIGHIAVEPAAVLELAVEQIVGYNSATEAAVGTMEEELLEIVDFVPVVAVPMVAVPTIAVPMVAVPVSDSGMVDLQNSLIHSDTSIFLPLREHRRHRHFSLEATEGCLCLLLVQLVLLVLFDPTESILLVVKDLFVLLHCSCKFCNLLFLMLWCHVQFP